MNYAKSLCTGAAFTLVLLGVPSISLAQDSRQEQRAAQQAEKALQLRPYELSSLERKIELLARLRGRTERPVFPFIGSAFAGGGLAMGSGYRTTFGDTGTIDAHAAWSVRNYKTAAAHIALPKLANDRIAVELRANWLDAPRVAFFGTGNNSQTSDRMALSYRTASAGFSTRVRLAPSVSAGGGLDAVKVESGLVDSDTAHLRQGYGGQANSLYRRSHLFAEFDSRTSPTYATRGGLYRVEWADYQQTSGTGFNFTRVDAEAQHFFPILRENWVIALRALASTTNTAEGDSVPYALMPDLGGNHALRGYPSWRFRDRHRLLLTGEYRWKAGQLIDMALFMDAGKVAARARDLDFDDFRKTYGFGVTVHTPISTLVRAEIARTREGMTLGVSFSPSF